MSRIVVMNHMTLDGVMQSPGRSGEDPRGGFAHGGWGHRSESPDDAVGKAMGERMVAGGGLAGWLFGRRTYEDLLGYWNQQPDSPFAPATERLAQVRRVGHPRGTTAVAKLDALARRLG